jgi:glycosyltransferase involved in cell wall biosynthesis
VNLLHIISGLGVGGAETMLVQLASRLRDRGFQQHVISLTRRGPRADELEKHNIPFTCLNMSSVPQGVLAVPAVVALIKRLNPDIIQGWMYHGNLVGALVHLIASNRRRRRLFWGIRASNIDVAHYRRLIKWSARFSALPDVIIANSAAGARFHLAMGYRPRRLEIVANGIDVGNFRPDSALRQATRAELGIDPDACIAIHVARVDPMKDHSTCLAALAAVPKVVGLLVGAGTEDLPLPANVRGLGRREDVARLYAASDIALSTSAFGEGFSNALAEGMSSGLVPITTDVGDARLIVGETGTIVSPRDVPALVGAIRKETELPPDQRRARGLEARNRILELYSMERAAENFARLYA